MNAQEAKKNHTPNKVLPFDVEAEYKRIHKEIAEFCNSYPCRIFEVPYNPPERNKLVNKLVEEGYDVLVNHVGQMKAGGKMVTDLIVAWNKT